jgi:hypothetical protein
VTPAHLIFNTICTASEVTSTHPVATSLTTGAGLSCLVPHPQAVAMPMPQKCSFQEKVQHKMVKSRFQCLSPDSQFQRLLAVQTCMVT